MIAVLRQLVFLAVAAGASWWLFLAEATPQVASPPDLLQPVDQIALLPVPVAPPAAETQAEPAEAAPEQLPAELLPAPPERPVDEPAANEPEATAEDAADELAEPESAGGEAPSELGDPDADGDIAEQAAVADSAETLMADVDLLEEARREIAGEVQRGFATVLLGKPEEQLAIARAFGEEVVLVPRSSLGLPRDELTYFRLGAGGEVQRATGLGALDHSRFRDLFQYEYVSLPDALRDLRRSVLNRDEIYLFGALMPASEWALVVGRRQAALAASGREAGAVRRFTLDYEPRAGGRYDIVVDEILFTDGTRFRPANDTP